MAALDPRRRPDRATAAYAAALFVLGGWQPTSLPAFQPLRPALAETAAALAVAIAAGIPGGLAARRLAGVLITAAAATER